MDIAKVIAFIFSNFSLVMFDVAVIFIIIHRLRVKHLPESEIIFRWLSLIGLGCTGIYTFIMHAFFPAFTASHIGWITSPFQFEVAVANLAFGLLGICAYRASFGFRAATVLGSACWLWGAAAGHIYQIFKAHNYSVGNAGSWFWMDILLPLLMLLTLMQLKKAGKTFKQ